jgi:hypothetical protein
MRKLIAAALAAASASACGSNHVEGGGPTVSRNYQIGDFQEIEVAGPYNVEVRTGGNPGVSASGSEKLLEHTTVEVRGDKLVIRPERSSNWFGGWSGNGKASFTVTVPRLSAAKIAGSGDIAVDKVRGSSFEGAVAGSGNLKVGAMDVQTVKLAIGGSGGVKAGSGKAQSAEYSIGGSGDLDASGIAAQELKVSIAGSGGVRANASGTADVNIMGSGDVEVAGGAKCNVSKMGSGSVRCS